MTSFFNQVNNADSFSKRVADLWNDHHIRYQRDFTPNSTKKSTGTIPVLKYSYEFSNTVPDAIGEDDTTHHPVLAKFLLTCDLNAISKSNHPLSIASSSSFAVLYHS